MAIGSPLVDWVRRLLSDRHALDAIARAVVSGERGLGDAEDALADTIASLLINRLEAVSAPGYTRVAGLSRTATERLQSAEERYGREAIIRLLDRTDKHLTHAALLFLQDGASYPRGS